MMFFWRMPSEICSAVPLLNQRGDGCVGRSWVLLGVMWL